MRRQSGRTIALVTSWLVELTQTPAPVHAWTYRRWYTVPREPRREDADELAELISSPLPEHAGFRFSSRVVAESELTRSERRRAKADLRSDEFGEYVRRLRGLAALERALAAS
jgi:hypothetical protein